MQPATALSALDHYIGRPTTPQFNEMTLLHYVCSAVHHAQAIGFKPIPIRNAVGVIVRPYFSPDPSGPKYEEYCRQKLIRPHQPVSTRLRIHRIRAHARPHNAVHSPSMVPHDSDLITSVLCTIQTSCIYIQHKAATGTNVRRAAASCSFPTVLKSSRELIQKGSRKRRPKTKYFIRLSYGPKCYVNRP